MEVTLKGVHRVKKRLADGTERVYHYAWRGGPRLTSDPGTDAFLTEYATLRRQKGQPGTVSALIEDYRKSAWFERLRPKTRQDYDHHLNAIDARFGTLKLIALGAKGSRRIFIVWHEGMRSKPRTADLAMTVLRRLFSYGTHTGAIELGRNPLQQSVERLSQGSRKDIIWTTEQIDTALTEAHEHIRRVVLFGLWTMQRQADILTMPTLAIDGDRLAIKQGKGGARVWVTIPDELRPIVEEAQTAGRSRILTNSFGDPWTSDGFRASFRREKDRLGIAGVTFHDLRGTGVTYCYAMGVDIKTIAMVSGHTVDSAEAIIRKRYLAGDEIVEAIRKART